MSNQNVVIKIIDTPRMYRAYDHQDETNVADVIRKDILPKIKVDYLNVNVKVQRALDGSAESLIAYMLRKETYTADVKKIDVDKGYNVKAVQDDYDDQFDFEEDDGLTYDQGDYGVYNVVVGTPCDNIPTAVACVNYIYNRAKASPFHLRVKKLIGPQATVAAYKNYLTSGVDAFISIGHGYPGGIILWGGQRLTSNWFSSLRREEICPTVVYFNSCQVHNSPLLPAVERAGSRTYIGGIKNLRIGDSEEVTKCFWKESFSGHTLMEKDLRACIKSTHYPDPGAWGYSGDKGPFVAGEAVIFKNIDFRGAHRHIYWHENNLNHLEDRTMNDQMSSFKVESGVWRFYKHSNYSLPVGGDFGPGMYPWVGSVGIPNDQVSSLRCIHS